MVPYRRSARVHSRSALVVVLLLSTLGLAGIMAYQALLATRSHQQIAENAHLDHAHSAAWQLTSDIRSGLVFYLLIPGLEMVEKLGGASPESPMKDLQVARKLEEDLGWPFVEPGGAVGKGEIDFVFRLDFLTSDFQILGDRPPTPEVVQWLKSILKDEMEKGPEGRKKDPRHIAFHRSESEERLVAFTILQPGPEAEAAFGFQTSLTPVKRILEDIGWGVSLLPPALTKGAPNEKLLSFVVSTPDAVDVFRSYPEYPGKIEVTDTVGLRFGGLTATLRLNPEAADLLVIGGLPKSRLPTILGLLALTSAMVLVAIFQLRREQELALLRTDFVSSVSHQLRTPLAQIRMFGETLLLGRVRNEEEAQRSLEIIVKEAQRLTHQVDNVLHFSRAERGEVSLSLEPTSLAPLVTEVLESFCPLAEAQGCRVEASLDETLVAQVDPGAFRQILLNLLENAVKYGPPSQIVDVRLRKGALGTVQLLVEDEGEGIPEDKRFEIFTPYSRLERDRDSGVAGSGIGLAVVWELVTGQGGTVRVEEAVSGGARFVVSFPRED